MTFSNFIKREGISILGVIILISCFLGFQVYEDSGPDALLYKGIGENLLNGVGYFDTIRNNEILPSIGYPVVVMWTLYLGISGLVLAKLLLGITYGLIFFANRLIGFNTFVNVLLLLLIYQFVPTINIWGVEPALCFSIALVYFSIILHLMKYNFWTSCFLGLTLFISLVTRPVLLPLIVLLIFVGLYPIIRYRRHRISNLPAILLVVLLSALLRFYSLKVYGDQRLSMGTYSAITLYSGFNEHIDLKQPYYSTLWKERYSDEEIKELWTPMNLPWKQRDKVLKKEVVDYIKSHPVEALEVYLWRLSKYSFFGDKPTLSIGSFVLMACAFYFWMFKVQVNERWKLIALVFPFIVVVGIQALFPYVGPRYYVYPGMFLILTFAILFAATKLNLWKTKNAYYSSVG